MAEPVVIYKTQDDNTVELTLPLTITHDYKNASTAISKQITEYTVEQLSKIFENSKIYDSTNDADINQFSPTIIQIPKDTLGNNIHLFKWATNSAPTTDLNNMQGFPFIEALEYDLDSSMFILELDANIDITSETSIDTFIDNMLELNIQEVQATYEPVFLEEI